MHSQYSNEGNSTDSPPLYDAVVKKENVMNGSISPLYKLPSYSEVVVLSDPPPSYHAIFTGAIMTVLDSQSNGEYIETPAVNTFVSRNKMLTAVINGSLFFLLLTFILFLPLAMIIIGFLYMQECPIQKKIPLYLILLGFFQIMECFGRIGYKIFHSKNHPHTNSLQERCQKKDPLVYIVIIWFIVGSMWVYQTNPGCQNCNTGPKSLNLNNSSVTGPYLYCNKVVYNFSFGVITFYYGLIGVFCFLFLLDIVLRAIRKCCCTRHIV